MSSISLSRTLLLAGFACIPSVSHAQAMSAEEVSALRAELAALRAQVESLQQRVDQAEATATQASTASATALAATKEKSGSPVIKFKGAPEIETESGWSFKPRGRLQWDVASVNAPSGISDPGLGFSNEVRRARLGAEGTIPGGFGYKFELEFGGGGEVELTDAFFDYKAGGLKVTVGQHNNFQSMEELTSSNDIGFMERAAFTDAFGFERRLGASVQYSAGALLAQAGFFTDNALDLDDDGNNSMGVDGRLVFAPKMGNTQLHFGASAHWRDLGDTFSDVRYRQRPLVHSSDVRFINTDHITGAKSETSYGLEAAAISGPFHVAGETYWQKVGRTGLADPTFFGGTVEAGYFFTGESRQYKGGVFKSVKVKRPVGDGGFGALQVNVRYDRLDLNDAGIIGGTQDGYYASLVWYPVDQIKFLINYGHLSYTDAAIAAGTDRSYGVDVIGARAQFTF